MSQLHRSTLTVEIRVFLLYQKDRRKKKWKLVSKTSVALVSTFYMIFFILGQRSDRIVTVPDKTLFTHFFRLFAGTKTTFKYY